MVRLTVRPQLIENLTICRHLSPIRRKVRNIFGPMAVDFDKLITGFE